VSGGVLQENHRSTLVVFFQVEIIRFEIASAYSSVGVIRTNRSVAERQKPLQL
jgi:hypothetical protein